ncbi:MAG: rRNA (cytidine1402-2-O)-methyltransferase [Acidobacteriota bacterium]|jgi:16S rRNA (cytidine1402-2'-O)-methyltransferase
MPGTLYVVATPIGNLEDVTLRALRILREVSLIAAEDTRRTARLLQHYSISTRSTSLHEHNERSRTPSLIARLAAGDSVALVSDAGTPIVSDPGAHLVAAAHAAGIRVEPIPGPSAVIAALSASGIGHGEFLFVGFGPARSNARLAWLKGFSEEIRPIVMYEAPHRITATLEAILATLGDRVIAVARELTKTHEQLVVGQVSKFIASPMVERGEFTVVISGNQPTSGITAAPDAAVAAAEFGRLTNVDGLSRRAALKTLALRFDMPARAVFDLLEQAKHAKPDQPDAPK